MPCGPGEHVGVFVCGVVVDDEMKLLVFRGLAVDQTQELEPLLMAVAIMQAAISLPSSVFSARPNSVVVP